MAANIEIKAVVNNYNALRESAEKLSDAPCKVIQQEDIFFNVKKGRLKLRSFDSGKGELIYYQRPDNAGPKRSEYYISAVDDSKSLRKVLELAYGIRGIVKKKRELFMSGNTRIHLDQVQGLGNFMELEVVMSPSQSDSEGWAIANHLMQMLNVIDTDLINVAYIDLLEAKQHS